jgi:hypothetical protein
MVQNTTVQSKRKLRLLGAQVATYAVVAAAVIYHDSNQVRYIIRRPTATKSFRLIPQADPIITYITVRISFRMTAVKSLAIAWYHSRRPRAMEALPSDLGFRY